MQLRKLTEVNNSLQFGWINWLYLKREISYLLLNFIMSFQPKEKEAPLASLVTLAAFVSKYILRENSVNKTSEYVKVL